MNLLDRYLISVNDYPMFKKSFIRRLFDRRLVKIASTGLLFLIIKILAEWLAEYVKGLS